MKFGRISGGFPVMTLAFALLAGGAVGCAGTEGPKMSTAKPADMPEGESWRGVYFHPVFGYLHMVEDGTAVSGKWKRADQSKWGEITGTKVGNLVHFQWKEHTYGLIGPAAERRGKGVFVYYMEEVGTHKLAKLKGEFGLDDDESGMQWDCVKQEHQEPKPESITGDNSATGAPPAAGHWDEK